MCRRVLTLSPGRQLELAELQPRCPRHRQEARRVQGSWYASLALPPCRCLSWCVFIPMCLAPVKGGPNNRNAAAAKDKEARPLAAPHPVLSSSRLLGQEDSKGGFLSKALSGVKRQFVNNPNGVCLLVLPSMRSAHLITLFL